jgi:hypothetical protein
MSTLVVIGSNSKAWQCLNRDSDVINKMYESVIELRTRDLFVQPVGVKASSCTGPIDVLIFSFSRIMLDNLALMKACNAQFRGNNIIYISSLSVHANSVCRHYNYPKMKVECELLAGEFNFKILRLANVSAIAQMHEEISKRYLSHYTTAHELLCGIKKCRKNKIVEAYALCNKSRAPFWLTPIYLMYSTLFRFTPSLLVVMRPFDFLLRELGSKYYGYNYIVENRPVSR